MTNMVRGFLKGEGKRTQNEKFVTGGYFNLSRNKSLRTLETPAASIFRAPGTASDFLKTVLSSITSPALLDVVIVYRELDFGDALHFLSCKTPGPPYFRHKLSMEMEIRPHERENQFKVFRDMHNARDFRLVLCADVLDCIVEPAVQVLEHVVGEEKEKGGLDYLRYEPLIISERRTARTRCTDCKTGGSGFWSVSASAL